MRSGLSCVGCNLPFRILAQFESLEVRDVNCSATKIDLVGSLCATELFVISELVQQAAFRCLSRPQSGVSVLRWKISRALAPTRQDDFAPPHTTRARQPQLQATVAKVDEPSKSEAPEAVAWTRCLAGCRVGARILGRRSRLEVSPPRL